MTVSLQVPYSDTSAAELTFSLALGPQAAVAMKTVRAAPGIDVELRILGCSHQVIVTQAGAPPMIETLACIPGEAPSLPRSSHELGAWGPLSDHHWNARVDTYEPAEFGAHVDSVIDRAASAENGLVAVFPGDSHAVTAMTFELLTKHCAIEGHNSHLVSQRLSWRTWHAYPQTGEIVQTHSDLAAADPAAPAPIWAAREEISA